MQYIFRNCLILCSVIFTKYLELVCFSLHIQLVISNSREGRRNLYLVLFDYVVHEINESCTSSGNSEYSNDEIQPIASLLTLADAPEALHISVKLGIEGIGDILKRSISAALPRYSNSDRLNTVITKLSVVIH